MRTRELEVTCTPHCLERRDPKQSVGAPERGAGHLWLWTGMIGWLPSWISPVQLGLPVPLSFLFFVPIIGKNMG